MAFSWLIPSPQRGVRVADDQLDAPPECESTGLALSVCSAFHEVDDDQENDRTEK